MHKLAEICVKRPVFATVLILVLVVFGTFGYMRLGVDRFPEIDFPMVTVTTIQPGTAPEEIESDITDKIEEAVNTISGLDELRSVSTEGVSRVIIIFKLEKDIDVAAQEVRDRINSILPDLPEDVEQPTVEKLDPDASPIFTYALSGPVPARELTEYADKVLRRQFQSVSGVGQVRLVGGRERQINVRLDPMKLRAYNLTIADVARAVQTQNLMVPGGTVKEGAKELTLRTMGRVESVPELERIAVANRNGHVITIADVGSVEDGAEEVKSLAEYNDTPAILIDIRKQSGTNTIEVVDSVQERFDEIKGTIPPNYTLTPVRDQSVFIRDAVNTVKEHLVLGSLLAAVVVLFFLANARTTLISAFAIPTSIISTFAIMYYMGFTMNILTLLALTLSVGIVIDDAIVVLENIFRFIEEKRRSPHEAAIAATREIGLAVLAITLSLIAVFMPVAFMTGILGRFMRSFGITMSSAIAISMLVSFTLTPMLASRWLRRANNNTNPEDHNTEGHAQQQATASSKSRGFYRYIERAYIALLTRALRHRWIIVLASILLMASIPYQMKIIPKNFLPEDDQSEFQVTVRAPEGTSLEATQLIMSRIARDIRQLQGVLHTVASTANTDERISNLGTIYAKLVTVRQRDFSQKDIMKYVRDNLLPKYQQENLRVSLSEVPAISGFGPTAEIQYSLSGPDLKKLEEYSTAMTASLRQFPGAVDVDTNLIVGKPQYGITIDRDKAADLGVSVADVARTLRLLVAGDKVSDYNEKGEQYEVHVRAEAEYRNNIEELKMVTIPSLTRAAVTLGDVVHITESTGPSEINRLGRARQVTIMCNLEKGKSQQDVLNLLQATAASLNMSPDYKTDTVGQSKEMGRAFQAYIMAFIMAIIFVYLVIAAQFESWLHPITILLALPLTLPFAMFSLIIFNQSLNIISILGVLVLFAVVKKNAILQIDHTNQLRKEGMNRHDAIIAANLDRLRPILMTTVAFVAGMIPLLVSSGTGAATNRAISSVVIGGQSLSLLLTLVATPVAYSLFDDLSKKFAKLINRQQ